MPDAKKQERRRRELKLREAEERKLENRNHAGQLAGSAYRALRQGAVPGAALLNYGLACMHLERVSEAESAFGGVLKLTEGEPADRAWERLRHKAIEGLERVRKQPARPAPAPANPASGSAPVRVTGRPLKPEPPKVRVSFLPPTPPESLAIGAGSLADHFLRQQLQELRLAQSFEDLVCLPSLSGVDSYIYQHETVRRVLRHFKGRALLADEVGLGKTIEACLVLKEYWSRAMVRNALVLTPPSLVSQWKGELAEKFGFTPASPEGPEFRRDPERFWKSEPLILASIAMARLDPHASALAARPWDMVIVDEAHSLKNRASANWKLVDSLEKKFILMLTATPVENNLIELYNLITLLKRGLPATEPEFRKLFVNAAHPRSPKNAERLRELLSEVMVRNTRSAVDVRLPHRVAVSVVVEPSPAEAELYERVSAFVAKHYRQSGHGRSTCVRRSTYSVARAGVRVRRVDVRAALNARRLASAAPRRIEPYETAVPEISAGSGSRLCRGARPH